MPVTNGSVKKRLANPLILLFLRCSFVPCPENPQQLRCVECILFTRDWTEILNFFSESTVISNSYNSEFKRMLSGGDLECGF
jgi:hypothetical protein